MVFATFLCLLLPLIKVFGDNESKISLLFSYWQLLVGHGVVAIDIVAFNVRHCTFVNIKFHMPLVGPIFQLVGLLEALLCPQGVLLCGRVWCHQRIWIFC